MASSDVIFQAPTTTGATPPTAQELYLKSIQDIMVNSMIGSTNNAMVVLCTDSIYDGKQIEAYFRSFLKSIGVAFSDQTQSNNRLTHWANPNAAQNNVSNTITAIQNNIANNGGDADGDNVIIITAYGTNGYGIDGLTTPELYKNRYYEGVDFLKATYSKLKFMNVEMLRNSATTKAVGVNQAYGLAKTERYYPLVPLYTLTDQVYGTAGANLFYVDTVHLSPYGGIRAVNQIMKTLCPKEIHGALTTPKIIHNPAVLNDENPNLFIDVIVEGTSRFSNWVSVEDGQFRFAATIPGNQQKIQFADGDKNIIIQKGLTSQLGVDFADAPVGTKFIRLYFSSGVAAGQELSYTPTPTLTYDTFPSITRVMEQEEINFGNIIPYRYHVQDISIKAEPTVKFKQMTGTMPVNSEISINPNLPAGAKILSVTGHVIISNTYSVDLGFVRQDNIYLSWVYWANDGSAINFGTSAGYSNSVNSKPFEAIIMYEV